MTGFDTSARLEAVADGIHRFDSHYIRPRHTGVYVVVSEGEVAIIDCAVMATVAPLLEVLPTLGVAPEQVTAVVVTHAHMDHAGGAGALIESLPNARLYAHPSAGKHLVDMSRLEAGVRQVFGDAFFEREYAPVKPVPPDRLVTTDDGDTVPVGARELRAVHTPGHAWHHQGLWEADTRTFFAGDAFGVGYPGMSAVHGPFFVPETPPPQFVPDEMHASIERILGLEPARVAPTHYETLTNLAPVAETLHRLVDNTVARCHRADSVEALAASLLDAYAEELERLGRKDEEAEMRRLYEFDAGLSAQGL